MNRWMKRRRPISFLQIFIKGSSGHDTFLMHGILDDIKPIVDEEMIRAFVKPLKDEEVKRVVF